MASATSWRALDARGISTDLLRRARPAMQTFTYTKLINCRTGDRRPAAHRFHQHQAAASRGSERQMLGPLRDAPPQLRRRIWSPTRPRPARAASSPPPCATLLARHCRRASRQGRLGGFARAHRTVPQRDRQAQPQEAEAACRALFGRVDYPALRRTLASPASGGDARRATARWWSTNAGETLGAHDAGRASGGHLRRGRQLLGRRGDGAGGHRRPRSRPARFGNLVASITIMKKGTGTASPEEVR